MSSSQISNVGEPSSRKSNTDDTHFTANTAPTNSRALQIQKNKATRRIRGEIACAECRRLKIKCDKIVPCSTCIKRGCAALCPNGTIPPGEGSRFVLAATEHLRKKTISLEARMRSLEDALAIITADQPHPLLSVHDEFENEDSEHEGHELKPVAEESVASALSESLGSLHIDGKGAARFFGPSGGSESLLLSAQGLESKAASRPLPELDDAYLPEQINICYRSFPFEPSGISPAAVQPMIEAFLPPIERAIYLSETFMEHLTWMFQIVTRRQVIKDLIPAIYKQIHVSYGPHDLALMLIVLAIGTLVDLNLPPYSLEAQHYYRLSRAALALQPLLGEQSIVTIKVLHLTSIYHGMSGKEVNLEQSYALLDLAGQVAIRIGFHVDPSLWGFAEKEAYDRRVYFWNLMAGVLWQSLVTGRPPCLLTTYIDCRLPTAEDEALFQKEEVPLGFGIWGFQVSVQCLIPLVQTTLAVKPPSYQAIMDLDRKIRACVRTNDADKSGDPRTATSMAVFVRSHYQALLLMFLHRGFFAQAMSDSALNPLKSPYRESVLAAYSSACIILDDTKSQYFKRPQLVSRVWRIWSIAFSAAVIVGTVAIRGVHLNLQPPALDTFESACRMFRGASETSSRAARAMPILQLMLQKASQAREHYSQQQAPAMPDTCPDDELSIFGGRTRLVNSQPKTTLAPPVMGVKGQASPSESQERRHQSHSSSSSSPSMKAGSQGQHYNHREHRSQQQPDQSSVHATFADLSGGWDGLFHEVPQPSRGVPAGNMGSPYPLLESGDVAMLDDRWASFMHNYNILDEPSQYRHTTR